MIRITKNVKEANAVTHCGPFHGDEVMATVILKKVFGDLTICRVSEATDNIPKNAIVYDIGGGVFDHHQKDGNGVRINGVPYASCGLIWKEFGDKIIQEVTSIYPNKVKRIMDREIFSGIDAVDNGSLPKLEYPARVLSVSGVISSFNPTWESDEDRDTAFVKAVEFAEVIFDNMLKNAIAKVKAIPIIEEKIENSQNGIMILDNFVTWQEGLLASKNPKATEIMFVVFPSDRGGYNWKCVPKGFGTTEKRKEVPKEWWGASADDLKTMTGVKTATFCYPAGFIGGAETLEDTVKMVEIALKRN